MLRSQQMQRPQVTVTTAAHTADFTLGTKLEVIPASGTQTLPSGRPAAQCELAAGCYGPSPVAHT
jgi:hypothetical protein